jgi:hypothetical protein
VEFSARFTGTRSPDNKALVTTPRFVAFLVLLAVQGFHLVEHITQVVQRYGLGIANGNGILGSVADIEPVHFIYNAGYLGLLGVTYLMLGLHRDGAARVGRPAFALLTFTLMFQGFHVVEHVFKMIQYVQLGFQNGTGGIFGVGQGGVAPLFAIPLLHLAYNAIGYLPALLAFVLLLRQRSFNDPGVPAIY